MKSKVIASRTYFKQIYCQIPQVESKYNYFRVLVTMPHLDHLMCI